MVRQQLLIGDAVLEITRVKATRRAAGEAWA